jgi:hypothetical protein
MIRTDIRASAELRQVPLSSALARLSLNAGGKVIEFMVESLENIF